MYVCMCVFTLPLEGTAPIWCARNILLFVALDQISLVRKVYRKYQKQTLPLGYLEHIMALNRGGHDFTKDPGRSQKHCFL